MQPSVALFYFYTMATKNKNLSEFNTKKVPSGRGKKIGIVVSEWNKEITERIWIFRKFRQNFTLALAKQFKQYQKWKIEKLSYENIQECGICRSR